MVTIVINRADGFVSLMSFNKDEIDSTMVELNIIEWSKQANPDWLPIKGWLPIDRSEIPSELLSNKTNLFRGALIHDGKNFDFHIDKCKEIANDHLIEQLNFKGLSLRNDYLTALMNDDLVTSANVRGQMQALNSKQDVLSNALQGVKSLDEVKLALSTVLTDVVTELHPALEVKNG